MNAGDYVIAFFVLLVVVVLGYLMFVWIPVGMYTEAECLRNGYPKYAVSIGMERYCMTLDGSVNVKVNKVSK